MGTTGKPVVLIVDNDKSWNKTKLEKFLERMDYETETAANYPNAIRAGHRIKGRVGFLFTALDLGEKRTGVDLIRYFDLYLPNFVCYGMEWKHKMTQSHKLEAVWAGAETILEKPIDFEEVRVFVMRPHASRRAGSAVYDDLTSLMNRTVFTEVANRQLESARRHAEELSLLFVDLNFFKEINDKYGHEAGDAMLQYVAASIRSHLRPYDYPCRWGGDEFVILLQGASGTEALSRVKELKELVGSETVQIGSIKLVPSIAIGIASLTPEDKNILDLVRRADNKMYKDKKIYKAALKKGKVQP